MDEQIEMSLPSSISSESSMSSICSDEVPGTYVPFTREEMIECAWKFSYARDENGDVFDKVYAAQHAFSWWRDAAELAGAPYEDILFAQDQIAFAEQIFVNNLLEVQIHERTPIFWAKYFQVWDALDILESESESESVDENVLINSE